MSTEEPSFVLSPFAVAVNAWQSTLQAVARMPHLFAIAIFIAALVYLVRVGLEELNTEFGSPAALTLTVALLSTLLSLLPDVLIGVAISRLVILNEVNWRESVKDGGVVRYALWVAAFGLATLMLTLPLLFIQDGPVITITTVFILSIAYILVFIRLSVFLPAIATDANASLAASWRQTRGSFWRISWSGLLASIPFIVVLFAIVTTVFGPGSRVTYRFVRVGSFGASEPLPLAACEWVVGALSVAVMAAVNSWIYRSLPPDGVRAR